MLSFQCSQQSLLHTRQARLSVHEAIVPKRSAYREGVITQTNEINVWSVDQTRVFPYKPVQ